MSVAILLMGLLMPAMSQVKENANRIICASNQRQIGQGLFAFAAEREEKLPFASVLHTPEGNVPRPENLMSVRSPMSTYSNPNGWDGLGFLYLYDYCGAGKCFYCPSHHGHHPFERYEKNWSLDNSVPAAIFSNYHYCGDVDWVTRENRTLSHASSGMALVTDGLRTSRDFNHETGMNVLHGDGAVIWRDNADRVVERLPLDEASVITPDYHTLWNTEIEIK